MSDQELAVIDADVLLDLEIRRRPDFVLDEARKAAVALKDVLDKKPNKVMMGGEQFLEFEDWQTVAHFYGCSVKVISTTFVQFGEVSGFEAKASAFHMGSGKEIAGAESMCLNDEEKWSARNKYEWAYCKKSGGHSVEDPGPAELIWVDNPRQPGRKAPKKEKVLVGTEQVPLFQLRSMAQTRACAKALRNAFAWVVVLAGYRPTPAEELPNAVVVPQQTPSELPPGMMLTMKPSEIHRRAQEEANKPQGDGLSTPSTTSEVSPQQSQDAPAAIEADYLNKVDLSQSVSEVSALLNAAVKDDRLDVFQVKTIQEAAGKKMAQLRKGK